MTDDHRCELLTDGDGHVIARARVSPDLDQRGRAALAALVEAVIRSDGESAEESEAHGRWQVAAIARVRARAGLWSDGAR